MIRKWIVRPRFRNFSSFFHSCCCFRMPVAGSNFSMTFDFRLNWGLWLPAVFRWHFRPEVLPGALNHQDQSAGSSSTLKVCGWIYYAIRPGHFRILTFAAPTASGYCYPEGRAWWRGALKSGRFHPHSIPVLRHLVHPHRKPAKSKERHSEVPLDSDTITHPTNSLSNNSGRNCIAHHPYQHHYFQYFRPEAMDHCQQSPRTRILHLFGLRMQESSANLHFDSASTASSYRNSGFQQHSSQKPEIQPRWGSTEAFRPPAVFGATPALDIRNQPSPFRNPEALDWFQWEDFDWFIVLLNPCHA